MAARRPEDSARATWWLTAVLLVGGCTDNSPSAALPREIITDLTRWDAASPQVHRAAAEDVARRMTAFALLRLETFSCGGQTREVAIYSHERTGLEFVLVPGGTFVMGSPAGESHRVEFETQHEVTLTRPFLIARTPCTQAAYERVVGRNSSQFKGPTLPVETLSWEDAKRFCDAAALALPTEAEWEYACRAGTTTAYCFGNAEDDLGQYAWYSANSQRTTHPVGQKRPNAFGLFDMHGNVWQYCEDWFYKYPDGPVSDPRSPSQPARERVFRGGSWLDPAEVARSAYRRAYPPNFGYNLAGIRPAKSIPAE
jgi:formylglycine-generating enzyme required for sulfatase activity